MLKTDGKRQWWNLYLAPTYYAILRHLWCYHPLHHQRDRADIVINGIQQRNQRYLKHSHPRQSL